MPQFLCLASRDSNSELHSYETIMKVSEKNAMPINLLSFSCNFITLYQRCCVIRAGPQVIQ